MFCHWNPKYSNPSNVHRRDRLLHQQVYLRVCVAGKKPVESQASKTYDQGKWQGKTWQKQDLQLSKGTI